MKKKNRIYEKKVSSKKDKSISLRMTTEEYTALSIKVQESGFNQSDYIKNACLHSKIETIPGAKELAKKLHQFNMKICELPPIDTLTQFQDEISRTVLTFIKDKT